MSSGNSIAPFHDIDFTGAAGGVELNHRKHINNKRIGGKWLAEPLRIGHRMNMSCAHIYFRSKKDHEANQMKERMIRCLG
jgi:hypothetical protein